jgi:hypothetical protein
MLAAPIHCVRDANSNRINCTFSALMVDGSRQQSSHHPNDDLITVNLACIDEVMAALNHRCLGDPSNSFSSTKSSKLSKGAKKNIKILFVNIMLCLSVIESYNVVVCGIR